MKTNEKTTKTNEKKDKNKWFVLLNDQTLNDQMLDVQMLNAKLNLENFLKLNNFIQ